MALGQRCKLMTRVLVVFLLRVEKNVIVGADLHHIEAKPFVKVASVAVLCGRKMFFRFNKRLLKPRLPLVLEVMSRAWFGWLRL